jgi:hypothetical protein
MVVNLKGPEGKPSPHQFQWVEMGNSLGFCPSGLECFHIAGSQGTPTEAPITAFHLFNDAPCKSTVFPTKSPPPVFAHAQIFGGESCTLPDLVKRCKSSNPFLHLSGGKNHNMNVMN